MAVSYTTTYNLTKPEVGASEDQWGGLLNDNLDDLDNLLDGTTPVTGIDINSGTIDGTVIGGTTPAAISATMLDVTGATSSLQARFGGTAGRGLEISTATTFSTPDAVAILNAEDSTYGTMVFQTKSTERMRITSAGSVGIGTSSPTAIGTGVPVLELKGNDASQADRSGAVYLNRQDGAAAMYLAHLDGDHRIVGTGAYPLSFRTDNTERMRIDASGRLLVGKTVFSNSVSGHVFSTEAADGAVYRITRANNTSGQSHVRFYTYSGASFVGSITTTTTSTAFNTSSDYRLKTDAQPMTGASARVQALKPVNFEWIADGTRVDGFLAHEAQEVVPEAVHGTKDAMRDEEYEVTPAVYEDVVIPAVLDEEGNELEAERTEQRLVSEAVMGTRSVPDYQGIDQSKLVPLLTAALQEALTEIADLKARVTALEA